jgi:DNA ligase D-like protein (predicted polymerase)
MAAERKQGSDERDGVSLTNLDQPLFDEAGATKRDLVDYLDAVYGPIIAVLRDRPLSVIRALRGQAPFMQKNVPKYTPPWVRTVTLWAESSKREVSYALCDDSRTLLWFANQRAEEYHVTLVSEPGWQHPDYLVLDSARRPRGVRARRPGRAPVRQALTDVGASGAVKTSGAKGVHVFVPVEQAGIEDVAAATRALAARAERLDSALATTAFIKDDREGKVFLDSTRAGGATVAAAYSPRLRAGVPVSFPVAWDELDRVSPSDFTVHTAPGRVYGDPWGNLMPAPRPLSHALVEEGHSIPIARVQAMHEAEAPGPRPAHDLGDNGARIPGRAGPGEAVCGVSASLRPPSWARSGRRARCWCAGLGWPGRTVSPPTTLAHGGGILYRKGWLGRVKDGRAYRTGRR